MRDRYMVVKSVFAGLLLCGWLTVANVALAEEAAETQSGDVKISDVVGYNKGFYIQSPDGNNKLTVGGYVQGLGLLQMVDSGTNVDTFRVRRARLKFEGNVYSKDITYELEYDFPGNKLLSTYIQYAADDALKARIGQFHVPFDFEALVSSSALQFVDRSLVYAFFGIPDERETGIGIHGALVDGMLEYNLGVFNGEGLNNLNQNNEFRYAGRLMANIMGKHGYEYSDVKMSDEPQLAVGVAGMYNDTPTAGAGTPDKQVTSFTADAGFRNMGWSGHASFYWQSTEPAVGASADDTGWLAQAGYMVLPKELEIVGRVGQVMPDAGGDMAEYTGGFNYYVDGHRVKLQFDYSVLTTENGIAVGTDRTDHRARAQVQVKL